MSAHCKIFIIFLVATASALLGAQKRGETLEQFEFQNRTFRLNSVFSPNQADLHLNGKGEKNLSAGMAGENILLGTRIGKDNFYVFWLNYRQKKTGLAFHDYRHNRSRLLPLTGFSSLHLPEIIVENGDLQALLFLGDNSNNLDIFHYDLATAELTALTRTPFSEKNLVLRESENGLEIETTSLWAGYRYRFDRRTGRTRLLHVERFAKPKRRSQAAVAAAPQYYNTYIGFGDSITWGQIAGVQRLDACYLTRMRDEYLALNYGPADYVNLGIRGDETYEAALRVDQDLDANPAFYFLLMLGVNDVWRGDFSLPDSMENLEYIVDAALARNMRVIVSTLTPRKDNIAFYQHYWDNLRALSAGILELASAKGVASIDTRRAFMNTNPPDGWKDLLETPGTVIVDGEKTVVKGNHPNEAGHELIASLFSPALIQFPPLPPRNVRVIDPGNTLHRTASWDPCYESDFNHFHIEFDFLPQEFKYSLDAVTAYHTFNLLPFFPQLYFRLQTVDRNGRASGFVAPAAPAAEQRQRKTAREKLERREG